MTDARVVAVLTAAGSGTRLGAAQPKALVPVAGVPLVVHALRGLLASGLVEDVVVTAPADHLGAVERAVLPEALPDARVRCVVGGATRQSSVAAGLAALRDDPDAGVVLVHDAARAFTPPEVVRRVVEAVWAGHEVVVPVVPVTDSVVDVRDGVRPVDRAGLRAVQTPQGFDPALLARAHRAAAGRAADEAAAATDDASLCAALGATVTLVEGHPDAVKVTTARDLALVEALTAGAR